jgi:amino acid adenylation domain-containing protein
MVKEWNNTAVNYDKDVCIHQLFERQVKLSPDSVAISFSNKDLTYYQLNQKANQLANYLRVEGVGPDTLVGIAVERSLEMVVGLLAILKAGGAYVPLDPDYPKDRLAYMIKASGIEVLLTQSYLEQRLVIADFEMNIVALDKFLTQDILSSYGGDNLINYNDANNLAYVIYTSGSTGRPKGVGNTHQALHNRLNWMQQEYSLTNQDCVLQKTPFSFDVSVWEFFWPLLTGAKLVIALPHIHKDPEGLVALIIKENITTLHFVPSMLQVFIQHKSVENCLSLRRVICSGEALAAELQAKVLSTLTQAKLYNLYGPTEAAIDVTHWTCIENSLNSVPIGKPIANIQTYILDNDLQPTPIGVIGELYLGGIGLARGYYGRSDLTAERFVLNPFNDCGNRLYRTGDLAKYRPDGTIDYVGRIDHQIKMRGFRIELGEIESALQSFDVICDAVVLAQESQGSKQLVAYVIPTDKALVEAESEQQHAFRAQLKEQLQAALPDYMVPSHLLFLEIFPVTPNGKLDRKALPAVDASQMQQVYIAPETELEKKLAVIWQDTLGIDRVGLTDNFFALGGHSLLATQVVAKAQLELKADFPFSILFEVSTLQEYASALMSYINIDLEQELDEMHDLLAELQEEAE